MSPYCWVLEDDDGRELRASEGFEDQGAAEDWMGREWASLRDEGASLVVLMRDEETVYRMSLSDE